MNKPRIKDIERALSNRNIASSIPNPERKRAFILGLEPSGTSFMTSLRNQLGYIRICFWISGLLFILVALFITLLYGTNTSSIYLISALLPFISLTALLELMKSRAYQMEELEMSCRYNLSQIMLMRMIIIGFMDFLLLGFSLALSAYISGHLYNPHSLYMITPFLLTSTLTLWFIDGRQQQESLYICGTIASIISIMSIYLPILIPFLYTPSCTPIWIILCFILIPMMAYALLVLQKRHTLIQQ